MKEKNNDKNNKAQKIFNRRNFFKTCLMAPLFITNCLNKELKFEKDNILLNTNNYILQKIRCPFCNVGCEIDIHYSNAINNKFKNIENYYDDLQNRIKNVSPSVSLSKTNTMICIKGISLPEILYKNRLINPVVDKTVYEKYLEWKNSDDDIKTHYNELANELKNLRDNTLGYNSNKTKKDREFIEIPIDKAIELIGLKTIYTLQKYSGDEIYSYSSSSLSIETHYAINKFMRGFLSSPNLDSDIRFSSYASAQALKDSTGTYFNNNTLEDMFSANMVCISGSNIRSSVPVYFWKYLQHLKNHNTTTLIIDPRKTATINEIEKVILDKKSNDIVNFNNSSLIGSSDTLGKNNFYHISKINQDINIINSIIYLIISKYSDGLDLNFINNYTKGFENFKKYIIENYNQDNINKYFGNEVELIDRIAQEISYISKNASNSKSGGILWLVGSGVAQNFYGYEAVYSIINLLAITGNLSRKGAGILPLYNQNNSIAPIIAGNINEVLVSGISTKELFEDNRYTKWSFTNAYNNIHFIDVLSSIWGIHTDTLNKTISKKSKPFSKTFTQGNNQNGSTAFVFGSPLQLIPSYNEYLKQNLSKSFSVIFDIYNDSTNKELADILLPCSAIGEKYISSINLNRELFINTKIFNNGKGCSELGYIVKLNNYIRPLIKNDMLISPHSNVENIEELRSNLFIELAKLTKGTEYELPQNQKLKQLSKFSHIIPYKKSSSDDIRFMFADKKERRKFYTSFRTKSGKVNLQIIKYNDLNSNLSEDTLKLYKKLFDIINSNVEKINTIDDAELLKIKSSGLIISNVHNKSLEKPLKEIKNDNLYPLWLCSGSVYEHYLYGITNHSKILSERFKEPYVEINKTLIEKYNLNVGEKIKIKTLFGELIAAISVFNNDKILPGRNSVPDYMIFIPYNIPYYKTLDKKEMLCVTDIISPLHDPITGVFEMKTPCRIEYL